MRSRPLLALLFMSLAVLVGCATPGSKPREYHPVAAAEFERVRGSPVELRMFLQRFPKGGDLHNHLSGAIYAEDFIGWGVADGVCVELASLSATPPPCDSATGRPTLATALASGAVAHDAVIDGWSMRNFVPGHSAASGHAQFFGSFSRFGEAGAQRDGDMLAEAVQHAADQHIGYLELMVSPAMGAARLLARQVGPTAGFDELYDALMAAGIEDIVPAGSARLDGLVAGPERHFGCPDYRHPACEVEVRFLAQVIRTFPPEQVFAQSLLAILLVERDPRVVGLNLVAPEDDPVTLATYETQMRQLGYLAGRRGPVPVTLHAGELALGLVHPRHLRNHIRQAVELAGARRIGHGVAIAYETDAEQLLEHMARERIAVEINLTSNDQILGVRGAEHPFPVYRARGVPVVLGTDDEGVSRSDLTHEYQRAVETYGLDYADILELSRNALVFAFVEGEALWEDPVRRTVRAPCTGELVGMPVPTRPECVAFLHANTRARLQWALEGRLRVFEAGRH